MILTVDVGNSNVVFALYDAQKNRVFDARYETLKAENDHYTTYLETLIKPIQEKYLIEDFIVSCVVPALTQKIMLGLKTIIKSEGMECTQSIAQELRVLNNVQGIGADLIATALGAKVRYKTPIIIADLGSATKITVLDENGVFVGGLILPGLRVSQDALNTFIPHLPKIPLDVPHDVYSLDTVHAMQAGLMYSAIDAVIGISNRIEKSMNKPCTRVLTGGLSNPVKDHLFNFHFEPFLLNEGLIDLYLKNTHKTSLL